MPTLGNSKGKACVRDALIYVWDAQQQFPIAGKSPPGQTPERRLPLTQSRDLGCAGPALPWEGTGQAGGPLSTSRLTAAESTAVDASISVTPALGRPGDNRGQGEGGREVAFTPLLSCTCVSGLLSSLPLLPTWISPSCSLSPPHVSLYLSHPTHQHYVPKELRFRRQRNRFRPLWPCP